MNFVFIFAVEILKMDEFRDFGIQYFPLKQFDYKMIYN